MLMNIDNLAIDEMIKKFDDYACASLLSKDVFLNNLKWIDSLAKKRKQFNSNYFDKVMYFHSLHAVKECNSYILHLRAFCKIRYH